MIAPRSVWSLLEMLKVGAGAFSRAIHALGLMRGSFICHVTIEGEEAKITAVPQETRDMLILELDKLRAEILTLDAYVTNASVERLARKLRDDATLNIEDATALIEQVESRLYDELLSKHVFVLNAEQYSFFTCGNFGAEVISKFPSASFDIDEAAKCMAFGRYTAAVFHLMRVMETALRAVHACLGISNPMTANDRTWGNILQRIRENYKLRPKFPEMRTFQELYALLDAVKDAWRNGTMHIEDKKTEDEAMVIFLTVKAFMKKLALRMDESGLPLA